VQPEHRHRLRRQLGFAKCIHVDALDGRPVNWPRWDQERRPTWQRIRERYGDDD
jgi:hypothetical protein